MDCTTLSAVSVRGVRWAERLDCAARPRPRGSRSCRSSGGRRWEAFPFFICWRITRAAAALSQILVFDGEADFVAADLGVEELVVEIRRHVGFQEELDAFCLDHLVAVP